MIKVGLGFDIVKPGRLLHVSIFFVISLFFLFYKGDAEYTIVLVSEFLF